MTVRIPPAAPNTSSTVWTIDYRETAPALANATMYANDPNSSRYGGLSVGVPGELRGLEEAHRRWGTLPWSRLVQPSVKLASGWTVGKELGRRIPVRTVVMILMFRRKAHLHKWLKMYAELMYRDPVWTAIFAPNGSLLRTGELIRRTNYSRTLSTIASEGVDAFYKVP